MIKSLNMVPHPVYTHHITSFVYILITALSKSDQHDEHYEDNQVHFSMCFRGYHPIHHDIITWFAIYFGTWYEFGYAVRDLERIRYVGDIHSRYAISVSGGTL
jgi:hypothetical protein